MILKERVSVLVFINLLFDLAPQLLALFFLLTFVIFPPDFQVGTFMASYLSDDRDADNESQQNYDYYSGCIHLFFLLETVLYCLWIRRFASDELGGLRRKLFFSGNGLFGRLS